MRYRVEWRLDSNNYFRIDCSQEELESIQEKIKKIQAEKTESGNVGKTYYRQFPLRKNEKIYF